MEKGKEKLDSEEIQKIVDIIIEKKYKNITLQFPDELLEYSSAIFSDIQNSFEKKTGEKVNVYILGDTSYQSCCIDQIAAQHVNSEFLIHFGRACLEKVQLLPVYHVFERKEISIEDFVSKFKENFTDKDSVGILYDLEYSHVLNQLEKSLESFPNVKIAKVNPNRKIQNVKDEDVSKYEQIGGLIIPDLNFEKMVYIGEDSASLSQLIIEYKSKFEFFRYSPELQMFENAGEDFTKISRLLKKRYYLIEKAKDVNIFGILIQTMSIDKYIDVLDKLKEMIRKRKRKFYVFIIGKMNEAKLANFGEIEMFIFIGCSKNSIIDSKTFMKDIITPYEVSLALTNQEWNQDNYSTKFTKILDEEMKLNEEIRHSLITGKITNEEEIKESSSKDIILAPTVTAMTFFEKRNYKGLNDSNEEEIASIEKGRSGIAKGYENEK